MPRRPELRAEVTYLLSRIYMLMKQPQEALREICVALRCAPDSYKVGSDGKIEIFDFFDHSTFLSSDDKPVLV